MILAIVVDTEGNDGTCYELESGPLVELPGNHSSCLRVSGKVGDFPFSGHMLASMLGIDTTTGAIDTTSRPV